MPRRLLVVIAAAPLAVLLAACPATTQNGATPTPSEGSLEAAAADYRRLADDFNARNDDLSELFQGNQTLPELQAVIADVAELDEDFLAGLDEITFPEEVQDEVADLRAAVEAQVEVNRQLQGAENFPEYYQILSQSQGVFIAVSEAANALRSELGLDPAPTIDLPSPEPDASGSDAPAPSPTD